ncbi:MAG: glycosyltransferase family 39 protein [Candidatus Margulisiibacteriota bacterium]|nr:glycosyltransferase family 39 protein [Candidatus Margulisiibacteriota bacterium]
MFLLLFLGIINLFKLWLVRFLPLLGDEAYYNLWSRYPALSYTDHPPMIAWIHGLIGQNEFGVRLGAIITLLIATWLIYQIGKEAFGKKIGAASAVIFNLVPTYFVGGLFLTPEQPLIIFWLLAIYFTIQIIKTGESKNWYLLGISIGLGLLSKYPMVLFIPGLFLFIVLSEKHRSWLKRKEPYLAIVLASLIASPVLIWNIQNNFPALAHHGARLGNPNYLSNVLYFFVLQFLMYSPPLFIFSCSTFFFEFWKRFKQFDDYSLFLIASSLAAFIPFLFVSPFTLVGGHWTSTVYLGIIVLLCHKFLTAFPKPFKTSRFWFNMTIIILINVLFVSYYAFIYPIPEGLTYKTNSELPAFIKTVDADYVFSNQMGVGSLVAFYGKTDAYLPSGYWKQFDIWGHPEVKKGESVLYFVFGDPEMEKKLKKVFWQVKEDKTKRLMIKDSDIPVKTRIYICKYFKGGRLP